MYICAYMFYIYMYILCVCVCVCVYSVCTQTHNHTHIHIHTHAHTYTHPVADVEDGGIQKRVQFAIECRVLEVVVLDLYICVINITHTVK